MALAALTREMSTESFIVVHSMIFYDSYNKNDGAPAVNIIVAAGRKGRGPLGWAGGLRGGNKKKKRKKMIKVRERDVVMLNLRQSSF